ncbi:MAG TPA: hypothetical protein VNI57_14540, partial [Candidatus Saccharimonadales bacterium]|nr:hypothetical protein [Candidatus Saccharimonadales bacterium]
MPSPLISVLLLAVLPALYLGVRTGLARRPAVRWIGGGLLAVAIVWSWPSGGADFVYIKRLNLFLAAAASALFTLRHLKIPWTLRPRSFGVALAALASLAAVGWLNFFSFHGEHTWIHLHDVAHYYLGSKYYKELGYSSLYTAMLRAEAETHQDHFKALEARDLESYDVVPIQALLRRSDAVKAAFTEQRWEDFRRDVEFFRGRLGPQYGTILQDHGFNPTPVWALAGGWLANRVPAGSHAGILALTLVDPLLILGSFALVVWAFGWITAVVAVLHFCIIFGATFGWTGGAFMRYLWFAAFIGFVSLLRKRRHAASGFALAVAASIRIFPVFFLLPLAFRALRAVAARTRRRGPAFPNLLPPRRWLRFAGGFAAGLVLLAGATLLPRGGAAHWRDFARNLSTHVQTISPNMVGLTEALAYRPGEGKVTGEEFRALKVRRQRIYTVQIVLVFVPALLAAGLLSRRFSDAGSLVLAVPLLYLGLSLASYYYVLLVLLVLICRNRPRDLALVFAAEAIPYALMLF